MTRSSISFVRNLRRKLRRRASGDGKLPPDLARDEAGERIKLQAVVTSDTSLYPISVHPSDNGDGMICDQRLRLLDLWKNFAREFSLTVETASKAQSEPERSFFRAAMEDVRQQTFSARAKLDEHRQQHGC